MARGTLDTVLGIIFIVFGILMIVGRFGIEALLPYLGILLIVVGILILVGRLPGGTLIAVVALVIGILLVAGLVENRLPGIVRDALRIINIVLGVILVVLGIQRLR